MVTEQYEVQCPRLQNRRYSKNKVGNMINDRVLNWTVLTLENSGVTLALPP